MLHTHEWETHCVAITCLMDVTHSHHVDVPCARGCDTHSRRWACLLGRTCTLIFSWALLSSFFLEKVASSLTLLLTSFTLCVTAYIILTPLFYLAHIVMIIPILQQGKQRLMEKTWVLPDPQAEEVAELSWKSSPLSPHPCSVPSHHLPLVLPPE